MAAFSEALRHLFDARQEKMADRLVERCSKVFAEQLAGYPSIASHARSSYALRNRLRRAKDNGGDPMAGAFEGLATVLSAWCRQGRRAAVRSVLRELGEADLRTLAARGELDGELATIMHEFIARVSGMAN
jgi:hypothetical protein